MSSSQLVPRWPEFGDGYDYDDVVSSFGRNIRSVWVAPEQVRLTAQAEDPVYYAEALTWWQNVWPDLDCPPDLIRRTAQLLRARDTKQQ